MSKLEGAGEAGCPPVLDKEKSPLFCAGCGVSLGVQNVCTGCFSVHYCDKKCQKSDWVAHKTICNTINSLSKERDTLIDLKCNFVSHVTPTVQRKLVQLVGERCIIDCKIDGVDDEALWDTGAQVSLVSNRWLKNVKGESAQILSLESLVGTGNSISSGASGYKIPYVGYITLPVLLKGRSEPIDVPFLVTADDLSNPIIGYNVIKSIAEEDKSAAGENGFFRGLSDGAVCKVMELLADPESEHLSHAKMVKTGHVIKGNRSDVVTLKINAVCVDERTPVFFEPNIESLMAFDDGLVLGEQLIMLKKGVNQKIKVSVVNTTEKDIEIPARMVVGDINLVTSIIPVDVKLKESEDPRSEEVGGQGMKAFTGRCDSVNVDSKLISTSIVPEGACPRDAEDVGSERRVDLEKKSFTEDVVEAESDAHYTKLKQHIETLNLNHLDEAMQQKVRDMLWSKKEAFSSDSGEIGEAKDLVMKINTTDEVPVQKNYYRIPKPLIEEVRNHVQDLLDRGCIKESKSANSSPVVLVRKKGGGLRVCCDFRELNRKTIPDKHPLPRIDDTLENLGGSHWFSVIDQTRAYYQGFIDPGSRWKTAFVTPWGLYEWVRIPFGLMNSGSVFQRHMEETFREYRDKFATPYLDDVIVFSRSLTDHILHVEKVLDKFIEKGLKVGFHKCNFFQQQVKFLGRVVSNGGYRMDEESIEAVRALKGHKPTTLGEVRQLLGLVGYHRRQVQDFAALAHPLTELLKTGGKNPGEKSMSKRPVTWLSEHQEALNKLIDAVTTQPILAYPDYNEKFFVHTDASCRGLGCILYQIQGGEKRVISYGSRSLLPAEKNYHSTKLEFLALKWAVCEKFRDYLGYGNTHFTVYTDNNPLLYIMQSTKLNANGQRWVSELSEFHFSIKYRPGVINRDADCLSRLPLDINKYQNLCKEEIEPDSFRALVAGIAVQEQGEESWLVNACEVKIPDFEEKLSLEQIRQAQEKDDVIRQVKELLEVVPKEWKNVDEKVKELLHHRKRLYVDNRGILRRRNLEGKQVKTEIKHKQSKTNIKRQNDQVVWPESLRNLIFQWFHVDMGHIGANRVAQLCRSRVFWPRMNSDIEAFISESCPCIAQKKPARHKEAELQSINTSAPLELITIDYLKLEKGVGGYQYILLVVDHFTRYVQGYATKNKSGTTAAKKIYGDFVLRFGLPSQILHDQGREFENSLFAELEKLSGVRKLRTTPYHPQCNGMVERMNKTILGMLRTLPEKSKSRWPESLDKLLYAYNCTTHDTTGFEPYFLMFGRHPKLPIDLILDEETEDVSQEEYARRWERQMREAYQVVQEKSAGRKQKDIERRKGDGKKLLGDLVVGDRVLVKNVREKGGPGKIRSYWEQKVYVVNEKKGEVVYSVIEEGEKDETKKRVLHRNMLLPVSQWFLLERPKKSMKTPKRNTNKKNRSVSKAHTEVENPSESEDDQDGEWFAIQDMQDITQHNGVVGDRRDAVEDQENDLEPDPEVVASEESDGEVTVEYDEEEG